MPCYRIGAFPLILTLITKKGGLIGANNSAVELVLLLPFPCIWVVEHIHQYFSLYTKTIVIPQKELSLKKMFYAEKLQTSQSDNKRERAQMFPFWQALGTQTKWQTTSHARGNKKTFPNKLTTQIAGVREREVSES